MCSLCLAISTFGLSYPKYLAPVNSNQKCPCITGIVSTMYTINCAVLISRLRRLWESLSHPFQNIYEVICNITKHTDILSSSRALVLIITLKYWPPNDDYSVLCINEALWLRNEVMPPLRYSRWQPKWPPRHVRHCTLSYTPPIYMVLEFLLIYFSC